MEMLFLFQHWTFFKTLWFGRLDFKVTQENKWNVEENVFIWWAECKQEMEFLAVNIKKGCIMKERKKTSGQWAAGLLMLGQQ